jgi:hypothetical protein
MSKQQQDLVKLLMPIAEKYQKEFERIETKKKLIKGNQQTILRLKRFVQQRSLTEEVKNLKAIESKRDSELFELWTKFNSQIEKMLQKYKFDIKNEKVEQLTINFVKDIELLRPLNNTTQTFVQQLGEVQPKEVGKGSNKIITQTLSTTLLNQGSRSIPQEVKQVVSAQQPIIQQTAQNPSISQQNPSISNLQKPNQQTNQLNETQKTERQTLLSQEQPKVNSFDSAKLNTTLDLSGKFNDTDNTLDKNDQSWSELLNDTDSSSISSSENESMQVQGDSTEQIKAAPTKPLPNSPKLTKVQQLANMIADEVTTTLADEVTTTLSLKVRQDNIEKYINENFKGNPDAIGELLITDNKESLERGLTISIRVF